MTIKKYLQSCIVIEKNGKRLLADPGTLCFIEEKITPEDIGAVDVIILTHSHPDHFYPEALKRICALRDAPIVTHPEIGVLLDAEGLAWQPIRAGESVDAAGFHLQALEAAHEHLPIPCPHNLAYFIDEKVLLPGDSYSVKGIDHCDILALPTAGPWSRLVDGTDWAITLKPRVVIPIHDAIIKDFFLDRITAMCRAALEPAGIEFCPLGIGEEFVYAEN
ncbi:MBL fold metallo-hydrolase [Candidatus Uhrbacteria bacterium]|nr:MBL fold metallo-hydrolase [Candidatus Uhrbacteria bacterium]